MDKTYLVNENGEVIKVIDDPSKYIELKDGDKVVRKGVLTYLSSTTEIKYHFIKINPKVYGEMANKYPILNDLIEHIEYMTNELRFRNGKPIRLKNIPKLTGKSLSTVKRQIKGLMEEDVIHKIKGDDKQLMYVINPYVAMRGKRVYLSLYEEFKLSALRNDTEECDK